MPTANSRQTITAMQMYTQSKFTNPVFAIPPSFAVGITSLVSTSTRPNPNELAGNVADDDVGCISMMSSVSSSVTGDNGGTTSGKKTTSISLTPLGVVFCDSCNLKTVQ